MSDSVLSSFWNKYQPQILGGLGGAGLGAAAMGGMGALTDDETDPKKRRANVGSNLALGASLGGLAGVGAGTAYSHLNKEKEGPGLARAFFNKAIGSNALRGAVGASALNFGAKQHQAASGTKGFLSRFTGVGDTSNEMKDKLRALVETAKTPDIHGELPGNSQTHRNMIRESVDNLTGNHGILGRLSQTRFGRMLGVNTASHEAAVAAELRPLTGIAIAPTYANAGATAVFGANGNHWLDDILGSSKGGKHGLPFIREQLAHTPTSGSFSPISRANALSAASRLGGGAIAGVAIPKMVDKLKARLTSSGLLSAETVAAAEASQRAAQSSVEQAKKRVAAAIAAHAKHQQAVTP